MKRQTLYDGHPDRKFFALFDFDGAYSDWVQLGNAIEADVARCLTRQRANCQSYAMLVPVAATMSCGIRLSGRTAKSSALRLGLP